MDGALKRADEAIATRAPMRFGAINAAKLVSMDQDRELGRAVRECEVILADGMGVVIAVGVLHGKRIQRLTGIDLMEQLVKRSAEKGYSIYFLGAKPEILDKMLERFRDEYPGLKVAGQHHGYFSKEDESEIVQQIRDSKADILFVAMGTPAKEMWIDRNHESLGVPICMGVGGSFDVFSGYVKRAPRWLQRIGLEWFFRFVQEPRRLFHRYFVVSLGFIFRVLGEALRKPFRGKEVARS